MELEKQVENSNVSHSEQRDDGRGQNPASQANLKPFEKGTSGNPSGRPLKNKWFRKALREFGGNQPFSELSRAWSDREGDAEDNRHDLVQGIWKDATGSDKVMKYKAIKVLTDIDGIEPDDLQP